MGLNNECPFARGTQLKKNLRGKGSKVLEKYKIRAGCRGKLKEKRLIAIKKQTPVNWPRVVTGIVSSWKKWKLCLDLVLNILIWEVEQFEIVI